MRLTPLGTLKKPSEFKAVRNIGQSWHTTGYIFSYAKAEPDADQRLGLILTKKIGNAVQRNRIKRRLRAAAREILPDNAAKGDFVLIGRAPALDAPYETLKKDMLWAIKRLSCHASSSE